MEIFQMHSVEDQVLVDLEMEILVLEQLVKVILVVMVVVITWDLPKLQVVAVAGCSSTYVSSGRAVLLRK